MLEGRGEEALPFFTEAIKSLSLDPSTSVRMGIISSLYNISIGNVDQAEKDLESVLRKLKDRDHIQYWNIYSRLMHIKSAGFNFQFFFQ